MTDLERMEGLFVGQLSPYEWWLFDHAVKDGMARFVYEGAPGFMGLAKVGLIKKVAVPVVR